MSCNEDKDDEGIVVDADEKGIVADLTSLGCPSVVPTSSGGTSNAFSQSSRSGVNHLPEVKLQ